MRLALQWIRENPGHFVYLLWLKTRLSLSAFGLVNPESRRFATAFRLADWFYWAYLLVALYGFLRIRRDWVALEEAQAAFLRASLLWLIALLALKLWLTIWLYGGGSRFLMPLQPYLVLGAVYGVFATVSTRPKAANKGGAVQ
jgi:fatty acid desaturase